MSLSKRVNIANARPETSMKTVLSNAAIKPMAKPLVKVVTRRQTREEERQFDAALQVFLIEMVHQSLGREGEGNG